MESGKENVLVVDDDDATRKILVTCLSHAGYKVIGAKGTAEGLKELATFRPELIISDVMMPRINGYEFCRIVRSREGFDDVPFIFCSALSSVPQRIQGLKVGADDYLTKPVNLEELLLKVDLLLAKKRKMREVTDRSQQVAAVAMSGSLSEVGVPEVLQIVDLLGREDLCLQLTAEGRDGAIWVKSREIVHAEVDGLTGEKALYRMLAWTRGSYRVERRSFTGEATMSGRVDAVVLHGLAYLDEYRRLRAKMGPGEVFKIVDTRALEERKLDAKAEIVLGVIETYGALDKVIENSPFSDLETIRTLFQLTELGVLATEGDEPMPPTLPR